MARRAGRSAGRRTTRRSRSAGRRPEHRSRRGARLGVRSGAGYAILLPTAGALGAVHGGDPVVSRWRSIWLVARRELIERGRSRAFLISLGLTIVLILAGTLVPGFIGSGDGPRTGRVGVVGTPPVGFGNSVSQVAQQSQITVSVLPLPDHAAAETGVATESIDVAVDFPADGSSPTVIVKDRSHDALVQTVSSAVVTSRAQALLQDAGIDPAELAAAATPPAVRELTPSDPNRDTAFLFANVGVVL